MASMDRLAPKQAIADTEELLGVGRQITAEPVWKRRLTKTGGAHSLERLDCTAGVESDLFLMTFLLPWCSGVPIDRKNLAFSHAVGQKRTLDLGHQSRLPCCLRENSRPSPKRPDPAEAAPMPWILGGAEAPPGLKIPARAQAAIPGTGCAP